MRRTFVILSCAVTLLGVGAVIFSAYKGEQSLKHTSSTQFATTSVAVIPSAQNKRERTVRAEMREYQNTTYHFSLFYPQELIVSEHSEGGNATTITFQNIERGEGFQIFVVPYTESQISDARFKKDVPSGVRTNLTNATIDGVTAALFYSTNIALGETREIWFIHGGYLFEVTTLKSLDSWLDEIIQTWKFIP